MCAQKASGLTNTDLLELRDAVVERIIGRELRIIGVFEHLNGPVHVGQLGNERGRPFYMCQAGSPGKGHENAAREVKAQGTPVPGMKFPLVCVP
jgi:hypothetical protein